LSEAPRYASVKAALDHAAAAALLVALLPLLALIVLMIRLDSPGPAVYRQRRVGRGGRVFTIYKFRTMAVDAPLLSTEVMQRQGRSPLTRLGPFLRKTSLDELPQLVNILKGEMSFIGPRPALPSQADLNGLREHLGVHRLLPGLTGLAQVLGRDDLDTSTKVACDARYCRELGFALDLRILGQTFAALWTGRGNK